MKRMKIQKVPVGETFRIFGDTFVALEHVDGGVLAIRKDIWKKAPFDENGGDNLNNASIANELNDYFDAISKNRVFAKKFIASNVDLKATDGAREYGYAFGMDAALLTLEQYGKYQHLIPNADNWWWLATPWRTPGEKGDCSRCVWHVFPNGYIGVNDCSHLCGLRPALVFDQSLIVACGDGAEEPSGTDEKIIYDAYLDCIYDWALDQRKIGESPMSYEMWKEQNKEVTT